MSRPSKQEHILNAAKPLFARFGLRKTTIDDIAQAAGLGKGTIYLYFTSKEDIFQAVVRDECDDFHARLREKMALETDVEGRLRLFVIERFRHIHGLVSTHGMSREVFHDMQRTAVFARLHEELVELERQVLVEIVEAGIAAGVFRRLNATCAALAISSAIQALEAPWYRDGMELPLEDKAATLVELFINGLGLHGGLRDARQGAGAGAAAAAPPARLQILQAGLSRNP
jgi:AcrR family transcriptional regulator